MKTRLELLTPVLLLLASIAWSQWTITSFDDSPDPGEEDTYVAQESSDGLKPVSPDQVVQQGNRLYVRQKFEDPFGDEEATYQIFQGRAKEAAKGLGKISLDGIPYATLLKMKLFYSRNAKGNDDLENVYFDGKDIFVEGEDPVYINLNGKMEELKPMVSRDFKISITSEPPGATVTVGGTERGKTPITFPVTSSKPVTAVISMEGYYTVINPVTPNDKQTVQEGVLLTARKGLDNPATAYRSQLETAVANKDANAIKTLKTAIQKTLSTYNSDAKKAIDATMSKFPANPPKTSAESSSDFSARQALWNNAQAKERDALNKDGQNNFNELKDLLAEVDAAIGEMEFTLKYEYIPNSAITFTNYGVKDFTISTDLNNSKVKFSSKNTKLAYGDVLRSEISQNEDYVHGVLKIWDTPNESGKFASIYDIAIFYDETPLKVLNKGTFTLSEATSASRNTEKDLNSRIAKHSGKAAWDKKDEAATLDALRRGDVSGASRPSPVVAAVQPPEEDAYYDEEEDAEEFDEGVGEQESRDYSSYAAVQSASDIFGSSDEILFWTGMVFAAAAIGTGVVGFLEHRKWQDANKAVEDISGQESETITKIEERCRKDYADYFDACKADLMKQSNSPKEGPWEGTGNDPRGTLYNLGIWKKTNETTRDSYNKSRIIWWGAAGISAAISITLFAW